MSPRRAPRVGPGGLRTFFALELPSDVRERVVQTAEALAATLAEARSAAPSQGVRWTPPENLHLTLKFLGELDAECVPRLAERAAARLAAIAPFDAELAGFGALPSARSARVLCLDVARGGRELARIGRKLDGAAAAFGVERERKPFRAHLTLGRMRAPQRVRLERIEAPDGIALRVEQVILYESRLSSDAPRYIPLARLPLGAAEDAEAREFAPEI